MTEEHILSAQLLKTFVKTDDYKGIEHDIHRINQLVKDEVLSYYADKVIPFFVVKLFLRELCRGLGYSHRVSTMTGNKCVMSEDTLALMHNLYTTADDNTGLTYVFASRQAENYNGLNSSIVDALADVRRMFIDDALKSL